MKIDIPYIKSKTDIDCGQLALKMVLEYFGEKREIKELTNLIRTLPSGLTWTIGIAIAAKKLGYKTTLISKSNFSHKDQDIEYYIKNAKDGGMKILYELLKESKELGIFPKEKLEYYPWKTGLPRTFSGINRI